jgi:hypothetical protein
MAWWDGDPEPVAVAERRGRWTWTIRIKVAGGYYGPWSAFGTRRRADAKARRLLARYQRRHAPPVERFEIRPEPELPHGESEWVGG